MNGIVVFTGTSLSPEEGRSVLPEATFLPPIARGDLTRIADQGARIVAIIDGVFDQSLAVAPREVREALERGLILFGASSMGALRAAELHPLGMIGVGTIFEWYRDGVVVADDEVGLHFDPDTYRCLSVPLVNIRHALAQATAVGILAPAVAELLLSSAQALPYPDRTYRRILRDLSDDQLPVGRDRPGLAELLEGHDLKREDALLCLRAVATRVRGS